MVDRRLISRARALIAFTGASVAAGMRSARAQGGAAFTMRLALLESANSVTGQACLRFAAAAGRRSNGQLSIEVYPNGQIVNEEGSIQALRNGVVDFAIQSTSYLARLYPRLQVFDLPFLFKDAASAYRVMDGPIGDDIRSELESSGIVGLCWGSAGTKELETISKIVVTPDDLKGLRIRTPPGQIYVATWEALGAVPAAINFNETYTALLQHVVDGIDAPLAVFAAAKLDSIAKHVSMTNHLISVLPLLGSKRKIEGLPAPLQRIVREEGRAVAGSWRADLAREEADLAGSLRKNGLTFTDVKYAAFRKAVEPVYAMVQSRIGGDIIQRIQRAA